MSKTFDFLTYIDEPQSIAFPIIDYSDLPERAQKHASHLEPANFGTSMLASSSSNEELTVERRYGETDVDLSLK